MKYYSLLHLIVATVFLSLVGCASINGASRPSEEYSKKIAEKIPAIPLNPINGNVIWGRLKVGMTVEEALQAVPNSKFDDAWGSSGMIAVMAEAGILANNKIKVNAEINGPFDTPSNLYILFDEAGRLDGVVIFTRQKNLPKPILANYGAIGYSLVEYKEAAKLIISQYAVMELGTRNGPPKFGKEQIDSFGTVGIAAPLGKNMAIGGGISSGTASPATIIQNYERVGYKSMLSIRSIYLGRFNLYSHVGVFMALQAKTKDDVIDDF